MGSCCIKSRQRKAVIRPSMTFWDQSKADTEQNLRGSQDKKQLSGIFTSSTENIEYFYEFTRTLGTNKFGTVKEAIRKQDEQKKRYAVKILPRYQHEQNTRREVQNLVKLDHPGICKFYETYIDNDNVYLVMEYCDGGSLSTHPLFDRGEAFIARIIFELLTAVHHMHSMQILHRNLNLKNLLFTDNTHKHVKIINLGYSRNLLDEPKTQPTEAHAANGAKNQRKSVLSRSLTRHIGTDGFSAPEVMMTSTYGSECDVWSLGVIAYCLLCGEMPFATSEEAIRGSLEFSNPTWRSISKAAKNVIAKMLEVLPKKRITIPKLLKDDWFKQMESNKLSGHTKTSFATLEKLLIEEKVRNYGNANLFKQMCIRNLVKNAKDADLSAARAAFASLDQDKNGYLEKEELRVLIEENSTFTEAAKKSVRIMLQTLFRGEGGHHQTVKYSDFLAATLNDSYFSQKSLKDLFAYLDTDLNGYLDFADLVDIMAREGTKIEDEQAKAILDDYSVYLKDGRLYFEEFYRMMIEDQTKIKESIRMSNPIQGKSSSPTQKHIKHHKRESTTETNGMVTQMGESIGFMKTQGDSTPQFHHQISGSTTRASQQLISLSNITQSQKIERHSISSIPGISPKKKGHSEVVLPQDESPTKFGNNFGESSKNRKSKFLIEEVPITMTQSKIR